MSGVGLVNGEMIGQYRVEAKLGEGGVGEVFKAVDTVLGRAVAIKRLRPEMTSREELVDRFREEARTLAQLHHPNIAILYGVERDGDRLLMVMEYVEGESISALLRRRGALPVELALPLFFQALDGIGYVHARGVVHRDIKGSNLMLGLDGLVKVMDFGIARVLGSERATLVGQLVGTPEYMPPEQIRGEATDARSDIYSLGTLLYAMLSGRTPFDAEGGYAQIRAQVEDEPLSLSALVPELPEELCDAVMHALQKNPGARYSDVEAFRAALLPFAPELSDENAEGLRAASATAPPGSVTEPTRVLVEERGRAPDPAPAPEPDPDYDPDFDPDPGIDLDTDLELRRPYPLNGGGNLSGEADEEAPTLASGARVGEEVSTTDLSLDWPTPMPGDAGPTRVLPDDEVPVLSPARLPRRRRVSAWGVVAVLLLGMNVLGFEHREPPPVGAAAAPPAVVQAQPPAPAPAPLPVAVAVAKAPPEPQEPPRLIAAVAPAPALSGLELSGPPADEKSRGVESPAAPAKAAKSAPAVQAKKRVKPVRAAKHTPTKRVRPRTAAKPARPSESVAAKARAERPKPEPQVEQEVEKQPGWVILRD